MCAQIIDTLEDVKLAPIPGVRNAMMKREYAIHTTHTTQTTQTTHTTHNTQHIQTHTTHTNTYKTHKTHISFLRWGMSTRRCRRSTSLISFVVSAVCFHRIQCDVRRSEGKSV